MNFGIEKSNLPKPIPEIFLWFGKVEKFLDQLDTINPKSPIFDLVITSPPYNIGKEYETILDNDVYIEWQRNIIARVMPYIKHTGHLCWVVGSQVNKLTVTPLDSLFMPIFSEFNLYLRNRIIWTFGHGQNDRKRFSGRYETILWYSKSDEYVFNLDSVRIPQKYPGKKAYKGPNRGKLSSNPRGKNPTDVWDIPNVKANHPEKTSHPCQFPIALAERFILSLTDPGMLVFDPFAGVCSSGVAAVLHNRKFIGCEPQHKYIQIAKMRISQAIKGELNYRPHTKPIYDHRQSSLSAVPSKVEQ